MFWSLSKDIKVDNLVQIVGLIAVLGQELLENWEDRVDALSLDERIVSKESNHFLVTLHVELSFLDAEELSTLYEFVPGLIDSVLVRFPRVYPFRILLCPYVLFVIGPFIDGFLLFVVKIELSQVPSVF